MNSLQTSAPRQEISQDVAREVEKIRGMLLIAQQIPRDVQAVVKEVLEVCEDPELAKEATYAFPKGNKIVTGPRVDLMVQIARCWGRISGGWRVVGTDPDNTEWADVYVEAMDFQSLYPLHRQIRVPYKYKSEGGQKILIDARDKRDWIANVAQRNMRTLFEQMIPPFIVTAAIKKCEQTLLSAGTDKKTLPERITALLIEFDKMGVKREHIEKFVGQKAEAMLPAQYIQLRGVWKGISDGAGKPCDYFDMTPPEVKQEVKPSETAKEEGAPPVQSTVQAEAASKEEAKKKGGRGHKKAEEHIVEATSKVVEPAPPEIQAPVGEQIDFGFDG